MNHTFVSFYVSGQLLALDILLVREINRPLNCTPVQLAPAHFLGLANLRGQIVTIMDLGLSLGINDQQPAPERHDIILKSTLELQPVRARMRRTDLATCSDVVGLRVDRLGDIIDLPADRIEPIPANLAGLHSEYLRGVSTLPAGLVFLVDVAAVLSIGNSPHANPTPPHNERALHHVGSFH